MASPSFLKKWKISFAHVPKQLMFSWYRHYKALFFFCFCVVLGLSSVAWYRSLHQYSWSDEQKKAFLDSYVKETNFKEAKFRETVDRVKRMAESHTERIDIKRDIFSGENLQ